MCLSLLLYLRGQRIVHLSFRMGVVIQVSGGSSAKVSHNCRDALQGNNRT